MDLSKYPRGSWLYIKSRDGSYVYGYCRVADTGTALVSGEVLVDLYFSTFAQCYQFGAKTLDVYVLS
jgi:3D (Asp-Asp-Asp) domain-containing protein